MNFAETETKCNKTVNKRNRKQYDQQFKEQTNDHLQIVIRQYFDKTNSNSTLQDLMQKFRIFEDVIECNDVFNKGNCIQQDQMGKKLISVDQNQIKSIALQAKVLINDNQAQMINFDQNQSYNDVKVSQQILEETIKNDDQNNHQKEQSIQVKQLQGQIDDEDYYQTESNYFSMTPSNLMRLCDIDKKSQEKLGDLYPILIEKNCFVKVFLAEGGEGEVYEGIYINEYQQEQEVVFKLIKGIEQKEINKQIEIMKLFSQNIYVVKLIDKVQINDLIHVFILEKCQHSLDKELNEVVSKESFFPQIKLCKMLMDLLDGLIQFRAYNVLHLDIKPGNILVSFSGDYLYSDFGLSSTFRENEKIYVKGYSPYYSSNEQMNYEIVTFKSDVYSLGVTFLRIIDTYKRINQESIMGDDKIFIDTLEQFVRTKMILPSSFNRQECEILHLEIFEEVTKHPSNMQFLYEYEKKIRKILDTYLFDRKRNFSYFLNLVKQYFNIQFELSLIIDQEPNLIFETLKTILNHFWLLRDEASFQNYFLIYLKLVCEQQIKGDIQTVKETLKNQTKQERNSNYDKLTMDKLIQDFQDHVQLNNLVDIQIADSFSLISQSKFIFKEFQQSLQFALKSLDMYQNLFHDDHPKVADSLHLISLIYIFLPNYEQALNYNLKSEEMNKRLFNFFKETETIFLNRLDKIDFNHSYKYLDTHQQIHPKIERSLYFKDVIHHLKDNTKEVPNLGLQSKNMRINIFDRNHNKLADSFFVINLIYHNIGNYEKAQIIEQEGLVMLKILLYKYHPINRSLLSKDLNKYLSFKLECLELKNLFFSENHPEIENSFHEVISCYIDLNDFQKALKFLLQNLELKKNLFSENQQYIIGSLNLLSYLYVKLEDYQMALCYGLESLEMIKRFFNENHSEMMVAQLLYISCCYVELTDFEKAIKFGLETQNMQKNIVIKNQSEITRNLETLSGIYLEFKNYLKVLSFDMRSQFYENQKNLAILATFLENLSLGYLELQEYEKALGYGLDCLVIRRNIFSGDHLVIANTLYNLSELCLILKDYKQALTFKLECLERKRHIYREDHSEIVDSLHEISGCYRILCDFEKALIFELKYLEMRRQVFSENHEDIITSLDHLSYIYQRIKDYEISLSYGLESLEMRKKLFIKNHAEIQDCLKSVIFYYVNFCYGQLLDFEKAINFSLESLNIKKNFFSQNQSEIVTSLDHMSSIYQEFKQFKKGIDYGLEMDQMRLQLFYQYNQQVTTFLNRLSCVYQEYSKFQDQEKALGYSLRSLEVRRNLFYGNHSVIADTLYYLGQLCKQFKYYEKQLEDQLECLTNWRNLFSGNRKYIANYLYQITQKGKILSILNQNFVHISFKKKKLIQQMNLFFYQNGKKEEFWIKQNLIYSILIHSFLSNFFLFNDISLVKKQIYYAFLKET